jgi:hypothetical protein
MTNQDDKLNEEIINQVLMERISNEYDERVCAICGKIKRYSETHYRECHTEILDCMNKARQQGENKKYNETIKEFLIELQSMRRGVGQRQIDTKEQIGMRYAIDLLIQMFSKRIKNSEAKGK